MTAQFAILPARAILDRELPRGALLVLAAVGMHTNSDGWAWPSQSRLAELAGMSRQMIGRYLGELERRGYVQRRGRIRDDGGRSSDEIRILFDAPTDALQVAPPATSEVAPPETSEVAPPATSEVARTYQKNEPMERPRRTDKGRLHLPEWLPADAWAAFLEMRRKVRAPMTAVSIDRTIVQLEQLKQEGHDPAEVLLQSVQNAWRGVFPLRKSTGRQTVEDTNAAALEEFKRRRRAAERTIDA